jgi:hypothetical protein
MSITMLPGTIRTTLAAVFLAWTPAQGPPPDCTLVSDPAERLACYDRASDANRNPDRPANYRSGPWLVGFSVDPRTGADVVGLAVVADDGPPGPSGGAPTLLLRCNGGAFDVLIDWKTPIRRDDGGALVAIGVDGLEPAGAQWAVSDEGTVTFGPDETEDAFLTSLYFARRLVALATREDRSTLAAGFDVSGLMDAVRPLWAACPPR